MNRPDISFVIIEYHSVPDVAGCAVTITESCRDLKYEIIISSNSSYSRSEQLRLQDQISDVVWIFNPRNGGFAYGMNAGLKRSTGRVVTIMNPDVRIKAGRIREAVGFLESSEKIGVLGPRIVDAVGDLQDSCRPFMTLRRMVSRILRRIFFERDALLENSFEYSRIQPVDWVIGACMMAKRDALEIVGGLDDGYFLYVEDMDWCKRFWDAGFAVMYYPSLTVEYKGDRKSTARPTLNSISNVYTWLHFKSYCRFLIKHGFFPVSAAMNSEVRE